jgi:hypothetical protein
MRGRLGQALGHLPFRVHVEEEEAARKTEGKPGALGCCEIPEENISQRGSGAER